MVPDPFIDETINKSHNTKRPNKQKKKMLLILMLIIILVLIAISTFRFLPLGAKNFDYCVKHISKEDCPKILCTWEKDRFDEQAGELR